MFQKCCILCFFLEIWLSHQYSRDSEKYDREETSLIFPVYLRLNYEILYFWIIAVNKGPSHINFVSYNFTKFIDELY